MGCKEERTNIHTYVNPQTIKLRENYTSAYFVCQCITKENFIQFRQEDKGRIPDFSKGVHMYKGAGVRFTHFFLNIQC